jgi:hypothetical protein
MSGFDYFLLFFNLVFAIFFWVIEMCFGERDENGIITFFLPSPHIGLKACYTWVSSFVDGLEPLKDTTGLGYSQRHEFNNVN